MIREQARGVGPDAVKADIAQIQETVEAGHDVEPQGQDHVKEDEDDNMEQVVGDKGKKGQDQGQKQKAHPDLNAEFHLL